MELQFQFFIISFLSIICFLVLKKPSKSHKNLPPGPPKVPIIGNILQLLGESQHRVLAKLSQKHGPIMHIQLAEISAIVVSSSKVGKEVYKTHDLAFADRAQVQFSEIVYKNCNDVAYSQYDDYWRQMRKICTIELFTVSKVNSFRFIREDEAWNLVESIKASLYSPINLSHKFSSITNAITCRATIGERSKYQDELLHIIEVIAYLAGGFDIADLFPSYKFLHVFSGLTSKLEKIRKQLDEICDSIIKEHEEKRAKTKGSDGRVAGNEDLIDVLLRIQQQEGLQFPITSNNIQGIIVDIISAGTETSSTALEWIMSELIRNPSVLRKVQAEIRETFRGKTKINESDVQGLSYLKLVIKEALRLHPPGPLLLPKECREQCVVEGYTIPVKTKLIVNAWAIGRDPEFWDNAERFEPERFENNSIDYNGTNLNYIPFGAGRRSCPGIAFGISSIQLPLALLLYHFNWELPNGLKPDALDMNEVLGVTAKRKTSLNLIATPFTPTDSAMHHAPPTLLSCV